MNKKIILAACALIVANVNFSMQDGAPTPSAPAAESPTDFCATGNEALLSLIARADNARIDDATPSATTSQSPNQEPAAISNPVLRNRKPAAQKQINELLAMGYANAPKQIQMVADKVIEHKKAALTTAFFATEGAMWICCPELFKLINYGTIGWAAHAFYAEKEKEKGL